MIRMPAFNLFLYNILLSQAMQRVVRIKDGPSDQSSSWDQLALIGGLRTSRELPTEHNEFPDFMVYLNYLINALALMADVLQRRRLGFLVVVVIMWNIFVLERILAFELTLIWSLWSNDISSLTYAIVISSITLTNIIHSMLIYESIKMHHGRLRFRRGEK
ncbi:uncharacterized protein LOC6583541 [Drosophila mojavensis]|uniref:PRA1 family protein n=1 Tax=Drosophila mojavensis TaxID=7230 RepID=B4KX40_DROMO|nr:uncharacterized protein LOC6583541 [Drosophila mojavensis]EDW19683.1 uncharacterized protein Dmoj_GI11387 [Drosophila mojavensis]